MTLDSPKAAQTIVVQDSPKWLHRRGRSLPFPTLSSRALHLSLLEGTRYPIRSIHRFSSHISNFGVFRNGLVFLFALRNSYDNNNKWISWKWLETEVGFKAKAIFSHYRPPTTATSLSNIRKEKRCSSVACQLGRCHFRPLSRYSAIWYRPL